MATDATGTPTSLGIPKYNPSVDAPSGLGFNAAMDAVDALIVARDVTKPSGIISGETIVWNGSAWVRSSVTKIGASSLDLGSYTSYTPTWSSSGTQPSIGNGTISARYTQIGKMIHYKGELVIGSTSTLGTGSYAFSLPAASPLITNPTVGTGFLGMGVVIDSSAGFQVTVRYRLATTTTFEPLFETAHNGGYSSITGSNLFAFTTSDHFQWNFVYEVA